MYIQKNLIEQDIKKIAGLQIRPGQVHDARDLFLFSVYCNVSFEECITAKKTDIKNGRVHFKDTSVELTRPLILLIGKRGGDYIFHYTTDYPGVSTEELKDKVNESLKVVADMAYLDVDLSF